MSILEVVKECQRSPNFVPPIDDHTLGRRMFNGGIPYDLCRNDRQRSGWNRAENDAEWAERNAQMVDGGIEDVEFTRMWGG